MLARDTTSRETEVDRPIGLAALRGVEVAELLRVITTLHGEGLLSDAEYQASRHRLVAAH